MHAKFESIFKSKKSRFIVSKKRIRNESDTLQPDITKDDITNNKLLKNALIIVNIRNVFYKFLINLIIAKIINNKTNQFRLHK